MNNNESALCCLFCMGVGASTRHGQPFRDHISKEDLFFCPREPSIANSF